MAMSAKGDEEALFFLLSRRLQSPTIWMIKTFVWMSSRCINHLERQTLSVPPEKVKCLVLNDEKREALRMMIPRREACLKRGLCCHYGCV